MSTVHLPFRDVVACSRSSSRKQDSLAFDPAIHLAYQEPDSRLSMTDLGLDHVSAPVSTIDRRMSIIFLGLSFHHLYRARSASHRRFLSLPWKVSKL
jgi:hypothetical protein